MHNFRWIFPFSLPIGCQKVLMHPNLYGKMYWLVLKRVLQEANGLVIGCKFASSLVLLQGGGRNFGPHIRAQPKVEYPPGGCPQSWIPVPNTGISVLYVVSFIFDNIIISLAQWMNAHSKYIWWIFVHSSSESITIFCGFDNSGIFGVCLLQNLRGCKNYGCSGISEKETIVYYMSVQAAEFDCQLQDELAELGVTLE